MPDHSITSPAVGAPPGRPLPSTAAGDVGGAARGAGDADDADGVARSVGNAGLPERGAGDANAGRAYATSLPGIGDRVLGGKYRVEAVLGNGGMGVVMAAEHVALGRPVALKCPVPGEGARFAREARAAARVDSPHVARVSDAGVLENGTPYMIMERLYGEDLCAYLRRVGPLPIGEAVLYVVQACDAIAAAHAAGVVHRDLKPSNLFLARRPDETRSVKVLDFGISKLADGAPAECPSLTRSGAILGTPRYLSPEQVIAPKSVDARTDIWGLGMVLYEVLTGAPMYDIDTLPALCMAIVNAPPPPLRALRPDAPAGLEATILRCVRKEPRERFASAVELALALAPFGPPEAARLAANTARRCASSLAITMTDAAPPARSPHARPAACQGPPAPPPSPRRPGHCPYRRRLKASLIIGTSLALTVGATFAASAGLEAIKSRLETARERDVRAPET